MASVLIEKIAAGVYETSFSVPTFVLRFAHRFLPESALSALAAHGLDVRAILRAHANGVRYAKTFMVHERGVYKLISVSLN